MVPTHIMHVIFLSIISQFAVTCWGQRQYCLGCVSEKFLNSDFSNLDFYEDPACLKAANLTYDSLIACEQNEACYVVDGIATYNVQGYGFTDTKLVIRNCISSFYFSNPSKCLSGTDADNFVKLLDLRFDDVDDIQLSSFSGSVCPCQDQAYCNDQAISPVFVRRHHTPPPNVRGLQCVRCADTEFPLGLSHYDYDNPSCEAGNLTHPNVFYHTCTENGACVIIDGVVTDGERLDVPYTLYLRGCVHGLLDSSRFRPSSTLRCLSREESAREVPSIILSEEDYYVGYDLTFEGRLCYCTSDFCTLSPELATPTERSGNGTDEPSVVTPVSISAVVVFIVLVILVVCLVKIKSIIDSSRRALARPVPTRQVPLQATATHTSVSITAISIQK